MPTDPGKLASWMRKEYRNIGPDQYILNPIIPIVAQAIAYETDRARQEATFEVIRRLNEQMPGLILLKPGEQRIKELEEHEESE